MVTVARGRNIFGDPSSQIQELTAVIKQVSDHLSTMMLQFNSLVLGPCQSELRDSSITAGSGRSHDLLHNILVSVCQQVKSRSGRESHHVHTHSSGVVVSLQSKLASISQDFKSILEVRTEVSNKYWLCPGMCTVHGKIWRGKILLNNLHP